MSDLPNPISDTIGPTSTTGAATHHGARSSGVIFIDASFEGSIVVEEASTMMTYSLLF